MLRRLLFLSYGGGHVAMLAPVARAAIEAGHDVTYLALTTAAAVSRGEGIPTLGYDDLWDYAAPGARSYGTELAAELPPGGSVSEAESIAYLGISFADLAAVEGEERARARFIDEGRHAFLPVATMKRFLAAFRPDAVIASNSPRTEQAALLAARDLAMPSVCVIDLFALQEVRWCGQPGYGTRVCVLNDAVRSMLIEAGRDPREVVVTGNPAFDPLRASETAAAGAELRQARGWDDGLINVLWASQIEPERHPFNGAIGDPTLPRRVEEGLRNFVRGNNGYRLIVRYHPSERVQFFSEARVEQSLSSEPLAPLLHAVDAVVVTASTVGLEANLSGKPVLSVDTSVFTPDTRYSKFGVAVGVSDVAELADALRALDGDVTAASGLAKIGSKSACQQVLDVIETVLD